MIDLVIENATIVSSLAIKRAGIAIDEGKIVARAKKKTGQRVWAKTCPHYLLLTDEIVKLGPFSRVNPPLRSSEDVDALWRGIARAMSFLPITVYSTADLRGMDGGSTGKPLPVCREKKHEFHYCTQRR